MKLLRFYDPQNDVRIGVEIDDVVHDVTERFPSLAEWLERSANGVQAAYDALAQSAEKSTLRFPVTDLNHSISLQNKHWLAPVDKQEVWAAGVTYTRSREARQEEAVDGGDVYARVYSADRPELFFKSLGEKVVGHLDQVGIRQDATWSVPEPELAIVLNPAMQVVGFTAGNDMSSRDIEGANPLYLPQAKVYTASCALGASIWLAPDVKDWPDTTIHISIIRDNVTVFEDRVSTSRIHRSMDELIEYLDRANKFEYGVVLMTGTGIVPPADFTLQKGDVITITVDGISTLTNTVREV